MSTGIQSPYNPAEMREEKLNYWRRIGLVQGGTGKKNIKMGQKLSKYWVEVQKLMSKIMVVEMKICSGTQFVTKEKSRKIYKWDDWIPFNPHHGDLILGFTKQNR